MTETGATEACTQLALVADIAKKHITSLREQVAGTTNSKLQQAIAVHATHVRQYAALVDLAVSNHASDVSRLGELTRQIKTAAADIEQANKAARALSINARIESSRSGEDVFKTIAIEMYQLSRIIVAANGRIQELASELDVALPRLIEQSQHLRAMVAEFTANARSQIDAVDREIVAMRTSVDGSLSASDAALAEIIKSSYRGLSALQFQDVCRQSLLQIDRWNADALNAMAAELHIETDIATCEEAVSAEAVSTDHAQAGEVVLF
ncbi:MAG: hypothetical protein QM831_36160 [Kofleriaceae bacterium]